MRKLTNSLGDRNVMTEWNMALCGHTQHGVHGSPWMKLNRGLRGFLLPETSTDKGIL